LKSSVPIPAGSSPIKKRVLFVEDDPVLLEIYVNLLDDQADRWEVSSANNGIQALQLLARAHFDVVVSDLVMPGMNGIELMEEVKKQYPRMSRIILSEISDQEEVAKCLNSIHQFLAKPFEVKALKTTLTRISGLDGYLHGEKLQSLVSQLGTLPSLPSLYFKIMRELAAEDPSIDRVALTIAEDAGMTARILQIVNSAVLGLARKISNPFEAVQYLGFNTVRSLVLSAHIFACFERKKFKGFSVEKLWNHSLRTGAIARLIIQLQHGESSVAEDAYTAGLLHDLGKLMLADNVPEQFQQAVALSTGRKIPLYEAEFEVFGTTHAGVAAYLLGLWGLSASVVEAVAFHHALQNSDLQMFGPLTAVHVASVLEHELSEADPNKRLSHLDEEYLAAVGVQNRLDAWRDEARQLVGTGKKNHP
jgi:HD-like signal output (HDOD) protein